MKSIVLWPRDFAYYARGWAAKKKTAEGKWILDSVASNATAHYLHNMFFVAGTSMGESAEVETIAVETYRANRIEMFDTCALRATLAGGAEILYLVSHAVKPEDNRNPEFLFEFEKGSAWCRQTENGIVVEGKIGSREVFYGYPNGEDIEKLYCIVRVAEGKDFVVCGAETASVHTKCINAVEELIPNTPRFPDSMIVELPNRIYTEGLAEAFNTCYEAWKLPSELGYQWAMKPEKTNLLHYNHFTPKE